MESKPTAFFFSGPDITKIEDGSIKPVDSCSITLNRAYLVKEPIRLLAGLKDETSDLDLGSGDMFITCSRYGKDGWEYYRFKVQSKELKQFILNSETTDENSNDIKCDKYCK